MRLVLVIIGALLSAILLTMYALDNPGYVLIARTPWSIEMSLTVFMLLGLVAAGALYLVVYLAVRLIRIPRDVEQWRAHRNERQARESLYQGLIKLAEANWSEAEARLLTSMRGGDTPLLSYLGAACVNQGQGNLEKRDEYLAGAHRRSPQHHLAIGMTQANLQYLAHQSEQALATLTELRQLAPKHKHVLKLLAQLYLELRDWTNLAELASQLRQNAVLTSKEVDALELRAHRELLVLSLPSGAGDVLQKAWNAVPKHLRRQPTLIAIYARQLIQQREMNQAEELLRNTIEQQWDDALVDLYGQARSDTPTEQLENAENWLTLHPEEPYLLLTLGRLSIHANREQKARGYLEKCINLRGPAEAYRELGGLLERLGEKDRALACYRRGTEVYAEDLRLPSQRSTASLTFRSTAVH
ncbi:MAG: heme biosynthesis protein HemY [Gammaproteobacteria bacterium]|nr:heme biosynthesis protein HemY [Gammaproteobacteria bacterium]